MAAISPLDSALNDTLKRVLCEEPFRFSSYALSHLKFFNGRLFFEKCPLCDVPDAVEKGSMLDGKCIEFLDELGQLSKVKDKLQQIHDDVFKAVNRKGPSPEKKRGMKKSRMLELLAG